jgi:predicted RNA-binding Zn-ribbon protein involved in translation (DUF1610 family)
MGERNGNDVEASGADARRGHVYIPCPDCGKAVLISEVGRVDGDPPTYECPSCGALLAVE